MNRRTRIVGAAALALGAITLGTSLIAGPLNPPSGPVASSYKTLTEVEPRSPISSAITPGDADSVYRISASGSYYLTGNITGQSGKHGIEIDADNVTLDLCGFELTGAANSLDGVNIESGLSGITVRDGAIRNWGESGVDAVGGPNARNCLFEGLRLSNNSTAGDFYALDMGGGSTALNCVAIGSLGSGIRGNDGCIIIGCTATSLAGDGIVCGAGTVRDCLARGCGIDGIRVGGSVVTGCTSTANAYSGIALNSDSHAYGNTVSSNGWGYWLVGSGNRLDSNHASGNNYGIYVNGTDNTIIRNTSRQNSFNYDIAGGNDAGPIESAATATSPWANF